MYSHVCICMYRCAKMCIDMCVEARGQFWVFFETRPLIVPGAMHLARLFPAGLHVAGILLLLGPSTGIAAHSSCPAF